MPLNCLIHCIKQFLVFHLMKIGLMVKKQNKRIGGAKVPNSDIKTGTKFENF